MSRRPVSLRAGAVDPFIVMDVMAAAAEKEAAGDTVIHLEVGQPSTPAPKAALAAACERELAGSKWLPPILREHEKGNGRKAA